MSVKMQAPKKQRWYVQIIETYKFASSEISFLALRLLGVFAVVFGIIFAIGVAVDLPLFIGIFAFGTALLATTFYFGKIAESAAYSSIDGQVGAAASVLNALRGAWLVTPAVGVDKNQNMVHRVVGRPGIILVGEGSSAVRSLLQDERKKMERFLSGVPVTEVIVGDGEGQVSIRKLQKHLKKLPKKLSTIQLREVRARVKSVGGLNLPMPKGPMPTNVRMPRR